MRKPLLCVAVAAVFQLGLVSAAAHTPYYHHHHHHSTVSDASALSLLPIALSVAAPAAILASGAALTVVAVHASAQGTVLVLERASDGVRSSMHFAGHLSAGIGTVVVSTAVSAGWILSAAGEAIAFIPNELGTALLYNERISR